MTLRRRNDSFGSLPHAGQAEAGRSRRRQRAAVRRARRNAGLPPDTLTQMFAEAVAQGPRSRGVRLGAAGAGILAAGLSIALWTTQPPRSDAGIAPAVEREAAANREGPPPAQAAAALPQPEVGLPARSALIFGPTQPAQAPAAIGVAALPATAAAAAPRAGVALAERALAAPLQASLVVPPALSEREADIPPWLANAIPVALDPDRPMIAVVIDDLGLNRAATRAALALPGPLGLAFLAYAEDLAGQTGAAREAGHEILLHQPMEPSGTADPGPYALLTGLDATENVARLRAALARVPNLVGINNHMGSRFTASPDAMAPVLAELQRRGLLYLDSRTSARSVGARLARDLGVPTVSRDIFLDHDAQAGRDYVERQLARLEAAARETGSALAIGHPHTATVEALRDWLPTLAAKGFQLVPVTALVRVRQARQLAEAEGHVPERQRARTSASGVNGRF